MSGRGPAAVGPEAGTADGARVEDAAEATDAAAGDAAHPPLVIHRRGRRVSTEPPPGYTGEPPQERQQSNDNDARLRADVPPHWG